MLRTAPGFVSGMCAGACILATGLAIGGADTIPTPHAPADPDVAEVIRTQRLEIVDEMGTVRLALGHNESGGAISVRDAMGRTMMLLGVATGGGVLVIHEADQRTACVRIAAAPDGGEIAVGRGGQFTGHFAADRFGAGSLILRDSQRRETVTIGTAAERFGRIETFDAHTGKAMTALTATRDGQGQLRTNGPDGMPRAVLTASERREGQLYTFADEGRPLIALATGEVGPAVRLFNMQRDAAIAMELDEQDGGRVIVYDRDGIGRGLSSQPPRNRVVPTPQGPPVDVPWREDRTP